MTPMSTSSQRISKIRFRSGRFQERNSSGSTAITSEPNIVGSEKASPGDTELLSSRSLPDL